MSASAGRVLLIPKGDFDESVTYSMLDVVYYNGKTYVCKQTTTGNLPTNTTYWQKMIDSAGALTELSDVSISDPQNGEQLVYNATRQKWVNDMATGITITTPPTTVDYIAGDALDLTGIVVTATYLSGTTKDVTESCVFSPANNTVLTTDNTTITATWNSLSATTPIEVIAPIYGVEWDGTSTTTWTRTDMSASFADPVPYYAGMTDTPSSPFDDILPWSGMVKEERTGGTMVKIPKFYYKLTQNGSGMKIQISPAEQEGYSVSPAHMDRGDGAGERDYAYVARYHCGDSAYKSVSGQSPKTNASRRTARSTIHNLGDNIWQIDFATWFTIWLLYLVEFADWNSQTKIGYGCGNGSAKQSMGASDSMPYHTGTMQSSRTTYGVGTQYRNIEDLWGNVFDWLDGCYYNSSGLNVILNPNSFSDSSGGTSVGVPIDGYPSAFTVKDVSGTFPTFIPTTSNGSNSTYSCDNWGFASAGPCLFVGANYSPSLYYGLFCASCNSTSYLSAFHGCRLMELPTS